MLHISEWLAHLLPPARDVVPDPLRHVGRALALPAARVRRGRRLLDLDGLRHRPARVGWDGDEDVGVRERWAPSPRCSRALLYACTAKVVLGALDRDVGCAPTQAQVLGNGRWPCTRFLRERCQNGAYFSGCIWTGKEGQCARVISPVQNGHTALADRPVFQIWCMYSGRGGVTGLVHSVSAWQAIQLAVI
jgi:hypothetical protein